MSGNRRDFIKASMLGGAAVAAGLPQISLAGKKRSNARTLDLLVLGGTGFIGPHMVREALRRGHNVTLFNRGRTNSGLFPDLETIKGDRSTILPPAEEIKAAYAEGDAMPIEMHDGSKIVLRKIDSRYDPTSRAAAFKYLREHFNAGEITTGLLYVDESRKEMHDLMGNVDTPLSQLPLDTLHPGADELKNILKRYS